MIFGGDAHPLIRTILGVDEATQSLTFAGDVPQGHLARLMKVTASGAQFPVSADLAGEAFTLKEIPLPVGYVIQPGDSLWKIAEREYGNGRQWKRIYDFNHDVIANPDRPKKGTTIRIPIE